MRLLIAVAVFLTLSLTIARAWEEEGRDWGDGSDDWRDEGRHWEEEEDWDRYSGSGYIQKTLSLVVAATYIFFKFA